MGEIASKIKPVIILPKGEISKEDIDLLRENSLCVVEAEHPDEVRFMEPPPEGYGIAERAAIRLFRYIVGCRPRDGSFNRMGLIDMFTQFLIEGTPLEPATPVEHVPTPAKNKVK